MAYCDFQLEKVCDRLGIVTSEADLFAESESVVVPPWFPEYFGRLTHLSFVGVKSRGEFVVAPILIASQEMSPVPLAIFSGHRFDVEPALGLVGVCDFLLATAPQVPPLRSPIAAIFQARENDIEAGLGPCIAQMVAVRRFQRSEGRTTFHVFGCVTNGQVWQFLRLEGEIAAFDRRRYYLNNLSGILTALRAIVDTQT